MIQAEPEITAVGYELAVERYDHASFGSAYFEYRRRGGALRLVWDGKDAFLRADIQGDAGEWHTVVEVDASAREDAASTAALGRFLHAVRACVRGRPTR